MMNTDECDTWMTLFTGDEAPADIENRHRRFVFTSVRASKWQTDPVILWTQHWHSHHHYEYATVFQ